MIPIQAIQVAADIKISKFRADFTAEAESGNNWELFYVFENNRFLYLMHYGVVVFAGYDDISKSDFLRFLRHYSENWIEDYMVEDFLVDLKPDLDKFILKNEKILLPVENLEMNMRIIMLNTAQSVGMDYYEKLTDDILTGTQEYIKELDKYGKIKVSKKNLLKFIGKTLNVKNSIVDNLYILDNPNIVWEDVSLDTLNKAMKQTFETYPRFKALDYRLQIVEDNLRLFTDLSQHRESSRLEWIIIALILIEVMNLIWKDILKF